MLDIEKETFAKLIKEYEVKYYETDLNGIIKPKVILQYLEDIASLQADDIHIGYSDLTPRGLGWFVTKYHLKISRLPKFSEKLKIITWPSFSKGIRCTREFEIYDENEQKIIAVASDWVLVNMETKKILNPAKFLTFPELPQKYAVENSISQINLPENNSETSIFQVRYDDIDLNNHVNNANYLLWAMETMLKEFLVNNSPIEIVILFKHELNYGEEAVSIAEFNKAENSSVHLIKSSATDNVCAQIKIFWQAN